jgi:hypothetical protein
MKTNNANTNCILKGILLCTAFQATIVSILVIFAVVTVSDHAPTIQKLSSIHWADIAQDISNRYMSMDKDSLNVILRDTKNFTARAKHIVNEDGSRIFADLSKTTTTVANNIDILAITRKMLYDLTPLINKDNSVDLKDSIDKVHNIVKRLDLVHINEFISVLTQFLKKTTSSMSPELLKELRFIATEFRQFVADDNTKVIKGIAKDTDDSLKNFNRLVNAFATLRK